MSIEPSSIRIISKLIDASFPDYRNLFPKDNNIEVVLPKAGNYSATAYYDGDKFHESAYTVFTVEVINNPNPNPTNHSGIPMEHTGNPLIALLFALITLPILRRK